MKKTSIGTEERKNADAMIHLLGHRYYDDDHVTVGIFLPDDTAGNGIPLPFDDATKDRRPQSYLDMVQSCSDDDEPKAFHAGHGKVKYGSKVVIGRYVDILVDKWFREILGAEANKDLLIDILRELIPERKIVKLTYGTKKARRQRNYYEDCHDAFFDVECTDETEARFVVEMQHSEQLHFHERALFYSTFPLQEQVPAVKRGSKKAKNHDAQFVYPPVYVVSFLNFSFHKDSDRVMYRYDLRERESDELMTDRISFIFLEMTNMKREPTAEDSFVDKIAYAFMNLGILKTRPAALVEKIFEQLFKACEVEKLTPKQQKKYRNDMTTKRDYENILYTAEQRGLQAGLAQGRAEGREEGREELTRYLKELGVPTEIIDKATALSKKETGYNIQ